MNADKDKHPQLAKADGVLISVSAFERFQRLGRLEDAHRQLVKAAKIVLVGTGESVPTNHTDSQDGTAPVYRYLLQELRTALAQCEKLDGDS